MFCLMKIIFLDVFIILIHFLTSETVQIIQGQLFKNRKATKNGINTMQCIYTTFYHP